MEILPVARYSSSVRITLRCQNHSDVSELQKGFKLKADMFSKFPCSAINVDRESRSPRAPGVRTCLHHKVASANCPGPAGRQVEASGFPPHQRKPRRLRPCGKRRRELLSTHRGRALSFFDPFTNIGRYFRSCPACHAAQQLEVLLNRGHAALTARQSSTN